MIRPFPFVHTALVLGLASTIVDAQSGPAANPAPTVVACERDCSQGASAFPDVLAPYRSDPIRPLDLQNSPRLADLVHDGHLRLSLSDALALAMENNLDVAVQRYVNPIAEADLLRTRSGQAARGVPGALVPSGLSAGALGVGVNQTNGTGGVGSAGGISGGGGAVQVGQVGTFDPTVSISTSYDRTSAPLNSVVVAGVPQVTTTSSAGSVSYTQLFPTGSSFTLTSNGIAQDSTQQSLLFNPAAVSRMALGFNQPLLSGAGFLPNRRFLMVAANNLNTSVELFRAQMTATVVQIENAYWSLSAAREAVAAADAARQAARELVDDTKARVELGSAAGVDITAAEAAEASAERDLVVAQTGFQLQQTQLKSLISKQSDAALDAAEIDTTDPLPQPDGRPLPGLDDAVASATQNRPELRTAKDDLANQDVTVRFTRNGLLPNVSAFGLYAASGLTGNAAGVSNGLGASLRQDLNSTYPEYAAGVSAVIPLRNRSAQADNLRARLEDQQQQVQLQRLRQQIGLEVRQALVNLKQSQAQVAAARQALQLAQRTVEAERDRLSVGISTAYDVILRERDLLTARQNDLTATASYAAALIDYNRATGVTLERNGIELSDALAGEPRRPPTPEGTRKADPERQP